MKWMNILMVFAGSGLGGVFRYVLGDAVQVWMRGNELPRWLAGNATAERIDATFPWGTLAVNLIGCFLIGLFYGLFDRYAPAASPAAAHLRLLLTVGFCGGFTTLSTFINENYLLFQSSNLPMVLLYLALSILLGFLLLYAGYALLR